MKSNVVMRGAVVAVAFLSVWQMASALPPVGCPGSFPLESSTSQRVTFETDVATWMHFGFQAPPGTSDFCVRLRMRYVSGTPVEAGSPSPTPATSPGADPDAKGSAKIFACVVSGSDRCPAQVCLSARDAVAEFSEQAPDTGYIITPTGARDGQATLGLFVTSKKESLITADVRADVVPCGSAMPAGPQQCPAGVPAPVDLPGGGSSSFATVSVNATRGPNGFTHLSSGWHLYSATAPFLETFVQASASIPPGSASAAKAVVRARRALAEKVGADAVEDVKVTVCASDSACPVAGATSSDCAAGAAKLTVTIPAASAGPAAQDLDGTLLAGPVTVAVRADVKNPPATVMLQPASVDLAMDQSALPPATPVPGICAGNNGIAAIGSPKFLVVADQSQWSTVTIERNGAAAGDVQATVSWVNSMRAPSSTGGSDISLYLCAETDCPGVDSKCLQQDDRVVKLSAVGSDPKVVLIPAPADNEFKLGFFVVSDSYESVALEVSLAAAPGSSGSSSASASGSDSGSSSDSIDSGSATDSGSGSSDPASGSGSSDPASGSADGSDGSGGSDSGSSSGSESGSGNKKGTKSKTRIGIFVTLGVFCFVGAGALLFLGLRKNPARASSTAPGGMESSYAPMLDVED